MDLKEVHIKKKEVIGKFNGRDVIMVTTHGGLSICALHKNGSLITVGVGPHPGVAKWIASKKEPSIVFAESMMKSEADKDIVCPLCRQLDTHDECLCIYRDGYVDKNATVI